jgi:hypothetical protein
MIDKLLDDIEIIAVSLGSLKALLGVSRIGDDDWETITDVMNDYSLRLRSTVDALRSSLQDSETCRDRSDGKNVLQVNA